MKFRYNQKVILTKGFYKGFSARILDVKTGKDESCFYKINVDLKEKMLEVNEVPENYLKVSWF